MDERERQFSDSDGTPRDDRFYTPRMSARMGGSSSDGEWATPRSTVGVGWQSDEGEYSTPRDQGYYSTQPYLAAPHLASAPKQHYQHPYPPHESKVAEEPYYHPGSEAKMGFGESPDPYFHAPAAHAHYPPSYGENPHYQEHKQVDVGYPYGSHHPYPYAAPAEQHTYNQPLVQEHAHPQSYEQQPQQPLPHQHPHHQHHSYEAATPHYSMAPSPSFDQPPRDNSVGYASVGGGGGSGGYQEHAQAKETPSSHGIAPGDPMDRAVDDIFSCARHNRLDEVEGLLDKGVPVNVRDQFGNTILAISCQNGNKRVAKASLRRGADINSKNYKGNTPLHFCFTYGYGDTLGQYLISKGADPAIRNLAGLTCYEGLGGK